MPFPDQAPLSSRMVTVHPIPNDPADPLADHARALFTQYGDFLRRTQSCNTFNLSRYEQEIAALPTPYAGHRGEVLLAFVGDTLAACIAWRDALTGPPGFRPDPTGRTAEIKRLFVVDAYRGHGLARRLVTETVARIAARHYVRIVLDTDHVHMPAALALYRSLGFQEFAAPHGNITFLDCHLTRRGIED